MMINNDLRTSLTSSEMIGAYDAHAYSLSSSGRSTSLIENAQCPVPSLSDPRSLPSRLGRILCGSTASVSKSSQPSKLMEASAWIKGAQQVCNRRVPLECSVVVEASCWGQGRKPPWSSKLARQVHGCEAGTDINIGVVRCDQPRSAYLLDLSLELL